MSLQKSVAAVHDISGFGKCSLTVALPVLSALGISTSVIPTAVLSTHTGTEFSGYHCRDMTKDMGLFLDHWERVGLSFDAIYTGYLGSSEQIDIVSDIFNRLTGEQSIICVDPVMGDHGKLYPLYTPEMAKGMERLCARADIIIPNITEAAFLTGIPYKEGPFDKKYVEALLRGLSKFKCKHVVLTGVWLQDDSLGAAALESGSDEVIYVMGKRTPGIFHGTGDLFSSALLGALLVGKCMRESLEAAVDFVCRSIERTALEDYPRKYGINFENELPGLMKSIGIGI